MRRKPTANIVHWSANIPLSDHSEMRALLPINGAAVWIIEVTLRTFLDIMDRSPALQAWAHEDIQRALYNEEKVYPSVALNVRVAFDLYQRFNEMFPEFGATTWFMRRAIKGFLVEMNNQPLEHRIEYATRNQFRLEV